MADSRRKQLIDLLRRDASTVKELAAVLRVPPKSLYYHINLLEKHGLIRVVDTRLVSGIMEKRYRTTAYLFLFREVGVGSGADPVQGATEGISSLFAMTTDDIRIGLESGMIQPGSTAPAAARLSLEWTLLNLSPTERDALDQRLYALFNEYSYGRVTAPDEQVYRVMFLVHPTYHHGNRPDLPLTGDDAGEGS